MALVARLFASFLTEIMPGFLEKWRCRIPAFLYPYDSYDSVTIDFAIKQTNEIVLVSNM